MKSIEMQVIEYHNKVLNIVIHSMSKPKEIECCQPERYVYAQCECYLCKNQDLIEHVEHEIFQDSLYEEGEEE